VYYKALGGDDHPNNSNPFQKMRMDREGDNKNFCRSSVAYTRPLGAPDDEVAMICATREHHGTGVMMEWERPISAPFHFLLPLNN